LLNIFNMNDFNLDFKTLQKQIQKLSNSSTIDLPNLFIDMIEHLKKGGKIYIKKANRGKFTASAKRAGQTVQEHARSVLNDPNATPLQKKRANFARNAAKWHHNK